MSSPTTFNRLTSPDRIHFVRKWKFSGFESLRSSDLSVQLLKFQRLHSPLTEVKDWLIKNPESFQYWNLKWGTDTELITLKDCSVHNHENAVCTSSQNISNEKQLQQQKNIIRLQVFVLL